MIKKIIFFFVILFFVTSIFANNLSERYASFVKNDIKQLFLHFTATTEFVETKSIYVFIISETLILSFLFISVLNFA